MTVYLVFFDNDSTFILSDKLFSSISEYLGRNYNVSYEGAASEESYAQNISDLPESCKHIGYVKPSFAVRSACYGIPQKLDEMMISPIESFTEMLFRSIDERDISDVDVYKRANLDHKLFSKILRNQEYRPSKSTLLALSVALELDHDQTAELLRRVGFGLSPCSRFDMIVEYFINDRNYNIFEINEAFLPLVRLCLVHEVYAYAASVLPPAELRLCDCEKINEVSMAKKRVTELAFMVRAGGKIPANRKECVEADHKKHAKC